MLYIDPVCKKKLRKKQEYAILKYRGNVYHFCCKVCKEQFEKNPAEYVPEEDKNRINKVTNIEG